jgi:hypothetical protein
MMARNTNVGIGKTTLSAHPRIRDIKVMFARWETLIQRRRQCPPYFLDLPYNLVIVSPFPTSCPIKRISPTSMHMIGADQSCGHVTINAMLSVWAMCLYYGWSQDKARQYAEPRRTDFGSFVRAKGFCLN